jgi:hypothetical protein
MVDKQIPEQAKTLGISEEAVVRDVMLKETVDGEFTTPQDVAEAALFFASFESNALTGQSLVMDPIGSEPIPARTRSSIGRSVRRSSPIDSRLRPDNRDA